MKEWEELEARRVRWKLIALIAGIIATAFLAYKLVGMFTGILTPTYEVLVSKELKRAIIHFEDGEIVLNRTKFEVLHEELVKVKRPWIGNLSVCKAAPAEVKVLDLVGKELPFEYKEGQVCWSIEQEKVWITYSEPFMFKWVETTKTPTKASLKLLNPSQEPMLVELEASFKQLFKDKKFEVLKDGEYIGKMWKFKETTLVKPWSEITYTFKV